MVGSAYGMVGRGHLYQGNPPYGDEICRQEQTKELELLHTMRTEFRLKAIGETRHLNN
jgi:hypothetical protein